MRTQQSRTDFRCRAGLGMDGVFINTNFIPTPFLMFRSDTPDGVLPPSQFPEVVEFYRK